MASFGPLNGSIRFLRRHLPSFNFLVWHWLYFILTCLGAALIFWGSSTPFGGKVTFTNSLFFTVSAMTEAGLNPVNLSELNTFQQILLFILIMLGSSIFVSAFIVHVRHNAFEKKFMDVEQRERRRRNRPLRRVRTWTTTASSRDVPEKRDDEEAAIEKQDVSDEYLAETDQAPALSRDPTPPERRGGPEMNQTISNTGMGHVGTGEQEATTLNGIHNPGITFRDDTRFGTSHPRQRQRHNSVFSLQGVGARPTTSFRVATSTDLPGMQQSQTMLGEKKEYGDISKYFDTDAGWIARNSQFHGLSEAEREQLGGAEYRAIAVLAWLVPLYFVLWQLLGCIGCAAWVALNKPGVAYTNGLNPWWVGAFNAVSAFNNSGMSLLDANMVAFQRSYYMLITMSLLILAGNTAYPIFLRLIIWCLYKCTSYLARDKPASDPWNTRTSTLRFLLDHPRRCYTTLFPSQHTWWLALSVFALNAIDWAAFEILNIGNTDLTSGLALRYRVIDGLFQAFAVRSGGFYVVTISTLRISLLVLYVVMMYIGVYPVVITMRNSNVYEERSLGIYAEDEPDDEEEGEQPEPKPTKARTLLKRAKTIGAHVASLSAAAPATKHEAMNTNFVRHQLRAQLAHDVWFLILALFLIMIIEAHKFHEHPVIFSVFNFIFEIVSAYGCVGISVGVPYAAYSFSGAWHTLSKLILCAVMLRGRHRGLPVAIDKAVLLPGEEQGNAEEEDGKIRIQRTMTMSKKQ